MKHENLSRPSLEACDTALEAAEWQVERLRAWPQHVDLFAHSGKHKWLIELQHWLVVKGYSVGEDSILECRPDQNFIRLYAPRL